MTQGTQAAGVTYTTGSATQGSVNGSQPGVPEGVPSASGSGLLSAGSSGTAGPSGASANGGVCLSVTSDLPVQGLSGTGLSCSSPNPQPSPTPASPSPAPTGGGAGQPGTNPQPAPGAQVGAAAGSGRNGAAQPGTICDGSRPVASTRPAVLEAVSGGVSPLGMLAVALLSLLAGYTLASRRRQRAEVPAVQP